MAFIDSNGFVSLSIKSQKLNNLKSQKAYYIEKKEQVLKDKEELESNKDLLEKYARERYLMKKPRKTYMSW